MSELETLEGRSSPGPRDLPGGTVTFLFTDIEGSTRLLKELRDRYGEVMAAHRRILRGVFEELGGREIDTQGDAFFVAFRRAKDAVLAAASAQRALGSHEWPGGAEVRVRMGLHTGEPSLAEHGYLGLAVHRGARIAAAAHGGQVLVSQTTRALLEDDEPPDVEFRDLGEHRLKDLDHPVRLFQLVVDGLPAHFPPPRTEKAAATGPFGGREHELAEAAEAAVAAERRRRLLWPAAVAILVAGAAAAAFLLTRPGASGLTPVHANAVGAIDPARNEIVAEIEVGRQPAFVEFARGSLWVANSADRTIMRVDPASSRVVATIPVPGEIAGLAAGGAGIWVAMKDGAVARVNADVNAVEEPIRVSQTETHGLANTTNGISVGPRDVWVTSNATTLTRIDASASRTVGQTVPDTGVSAAIDVTKTSVWFGGEFYVSEFEVELGRVVGEVRIPSRFPEALAAAHGALWVLAAPQKLVKVDVQSLSTTAEITLGGDPSALAVGEGAVWVADGARGTVSRVDPATARVVETVDVGNSVSDVATGGDRVWVTVR